MEISHGFGISLPIMPVDYLQVEDSPLEFEVSLHPYRHTNDYLLVNTPAETLP